MSKRTAGDLAKAVDVTASAFSQWVNGQSHPSAQNLIDLSLETGLSLGFLSAVAANHSGKREPVAADLYGRIAALPDLLRANVVAAIDQAERLRDNLPASALQRPVPNLAVEDAYYNGDAVASHPLRRSTDK